MDFSGGFNLTFELCVGDGTHNITFITAHVGLNVRSSVTETLSRYSHNGTSIQRTTAGGYVGYFQSIGNALGAGSATTVRLEYQIKFN